MQVLLSHWHCILPILAIVAAMIFMNRGKSNKKSKNDGTDVGSNEQEY